MACYDAYRAFMGVHQNIVMQSNRGADSKSYVIDLLRQHMLAPDTSILMTYESLKNKVAPGANWNDSIFFWEELPQGSIDKNGGEAERYMKQVWCPQRERPSFLIMRVV